MLLIETTIDQLNGCVAEWNRRLLIDLWFYQKNDTYILWSVGNVLVTGIQIAPGFVMVEFDNFDLQGATRQAELGCERLTELLKIGFVVNDTPEASRTFGLMERQAERALRVLPYGNEIVDEDGFSLEQKRQARITVVQAAWEWWRSKTGEWIVMRQYKRE